MSDILSTAALVGIQQQLYENSKKPGGLTKWQEEEIANMVIEARKKVRGLEETVADYENMLTMPMMELAKKTGKFAETYLRQQEILANFMVSNKSWKNIATRKMKAQGMSDKEIELEFRKEVPVAADQIDGQNGIDVTQVKKLNAKKLAALEQE